MRWSERRAGTRREKIEGYTPTIEGVVCERREERNVIIQGLAQTSRNQLTLEKKDRGLKTSSFSRLISSVKLLTVGCVLEEAHKSESDHVHVPRTEDVNGQI